MSTNRHAGRRLAIASLVALAAGAFPVQVAHAAAARYASPSGSGTVCSHQQPCGIIEAVDQAPAASEVIIEPGHYGTAAAPLTTEITDASTGQLRVHGIAGRPLPVIHSAADYAIRMQSSHLSFVKVLAAGSTGGVLGTYGDHLDVRATGTTGPACTVTVRLSESLCVGSGATTDAIGYSIPGSQLITLNNVTAVADGVHAEAFVLHETGASLATVNASSCVFVGAAYDIGVFAASSGQAELNVSHSRYKSRAPIALGGGSTAVNDIGGNTTEPARFVGAASGDYRETTTSPTVDAGTKDPDFSTDLKDEPRSLGHGPDMGAYELLLPPKIAKLRVATISAHSMTAKASVRGKGLPARVTLTAKHGGHTIESRVTKLGAGSAASAVTLAIHKLRRRTDYRLRLIVRTDGGRATSPATRLATSG